MDRYNHDLGEDTDDTDDSPLIGSFSSCSPQYRKVTQSSRLGFSEEEDASSSSVQLKAFSRGDSGQSDHSESPLSHLDSSNFETPELEVAPSTSRSESVATSLPSTSAKTSSKESPSTSTGTSGSLKAQPACLSTPESSQTESDDVSPQIQRKRRLHNKENLPRFSISIEENKTRYIFMYYSTTKLIS